MLFVMPTPSQIVSPTPTRPTRLWTWFLVGFVIVFVGMLQFFTIYDLIPSGRGIAKVNLWQYYSRRVPHLFAAQPLGPGTTSSAAVFRTFMQHATCAGLGGVVTLIIGWKRKQRRLRRGEVG